MARRGHVTLPTIHGEGSVLLFCSLVVLDPRVGHTMDVLSPFISVLCHSDWLFHGGSCPRLDVVHPGRVWSSSPACTWHCSLHYLFLQSTPLFPHGVTISMLVSLLWQCLTVPSLLQLCFLCCSWNLQSFHDEGDSYNWVHSKKRTVEQYGQMFCSPPNLVTDTSYHFTFHLWVWWHGPRTRHTTPSHLQHSGYKVLYNFAIFWWLMPSSHHRQEQDKTVLTWHVLSVSVVWTENWRQANTVGDRKFRNCFVQS